MSNRFLAIAYLQRTLSAGGIEEVHLDVGVNLMVGSPNTGKTKWLQTLDYLLGDSGEHPYFDDEKGGESLAEKYSGAKAVLVVSGETLTIERRWREPGAKTKVFVDGQPLDSMDFQRLLLQKLEMPFISFPKGNPMSGQTWPQLSFRILLRHIYRQQRFWSGLVDQQSDPEQLAAVLQFLGIAESVFTPEYGELVSLKLEADKIRARREQHAQALKDIALDVLAEPELTVEVNERTVVDASTRLKANYEELLSQRKDLLTSVLSFASASHEAQSIALGEQRALLLQEIESLKGLLLGAQSRHREIRNYSLGLDDETDRMARAADAGRVLADLKVTHCPSCDQSVQHRTVASGTCFLCHQAIAQEPIFEELGSVRLRFEQDRILAEKKEANELLGVVGREIEALRRRMSETEEQIRSVEHKLRPVRQAVSSLVQDEISAIDMQIGELAERQKHINRLGNAVDSGKRLGEQLTYLGQKIATLRQVVDETAEATDFELAAGRLEAGMNAYLNSINVLRPNVWKHSGVEVSLSRTSFEIRIGRRKWNKVLGGTDSLYFLMAYHFGLLTLSVAPGCHYPGLVIIDMPGEFSGEKIGDIENFVVQPFVDLLATDAYSEAQVIVTGPSFKGLSAARRTQFLHVYAAR